MLNALGIINMEDSTVDIAGLQSFRPVSAISLLGRYRIIDFVLSNMTNSGINDIQVYCKEKPRSLIEHLGTGQHYNINSKKGRLRFLVGERSETTEIYNTDIASFKRFMQYIEENDKPYVIVAPTYMLYRVNFEEALKNHINNKNDISVLYKYTDNAKEEFFGCDSLTLDSDKRIISIEQNRGKYKNRNISLEAYIMSRPLFIDLVNMAAKSSSLYWFKDILRDVLDEYKVCGMSVRNDVSCLNTLEAYYKTNIKYCNRENIMAFDDHNWPILTMTNDSSPTIYGEDSVVKNSMIANGCKIEGTVINSVLGRNVVIKKGAVVKNSVVLSEAFIAPNAKLDKVVVDKGAIINHVKKLEGSDTTPIYVKRRDRI